MPSHPKYSPEVVKKILKNVSKGITNAQAARCAGISEATFYEWMKSKTGLSESIKKARDEGEVANLDVIVKARDKNWTAAAWLLERQHPDTYALKQKLEHSGKIDSHARVTNVLDTMSIKAMETLEAKLDKLLRGPRA